MIREMMSYQEMKDLGEQMANWVLPKISRDDSFYQRAYAIYRDGQIYNAKKSKNGVLLTVYDEREHCERDVMLSVSQLTESTCSCQGTLPCIHILASFFYMYSSFYPLGGWRTALQKRQQQNLSSLGVMKANELLERNAITRPKTVERLHSNRPIVDVPQSLKAWRKLIDETINNRGTLAHTYYRFAEIYFIREVAEEVVLRFRVAYRELCESKPIYELYLLLTVAVHVNKAIIAMPQDTYNLRLIQTSLNNLMNEIRESCERFNSQKLTPEEQESMNEICCDLLSDQPLANELAWHGIASFVGVSGTQDETLLFIEQHTSGKQKQIASFWRVFFDEEDEDARALLKQLGGDGLTILHVILSVVHGNYGKERMLFWILATGECAVQCVKTMPHSQELKDAINELLRFYSHLASTLDIETEFFALCRELLPYSYNYYAHFLTLNDRYEEWVQLMVASGIEIVHWDKDVLKVIEQKHPELAIPHYIHQAEKLYAEKKRQSYHYANRYVRKIRTLCKRMKQETRYEQYVWSLLHRTKRMRALREELEGGNILP
ncbi:MAG: SWIM zinc finger family protein [Bacilli bacterium]